MLIGGPKETLGTLNASIGITAAILNPTTGIMAGKKIAAATMQPKTKSVYVTWDGGAATNTCLLLEVGDILRLEGYHNLVKFRAIESAASASMLVIPEYLV